MLRGALGDGHTSHLHTGKILRLSDDLPLIVERVDTPEAIERFLEHVEPRLERCMVTMTPARRLRRAVRAAQGADSTD